MRSLCLGSRPLRWKVHGIPQARTSGYRSIQGTDVVCILGRPGKHRCMAGAAEGPGMGCGLWLLLLPPFPAFLSKAWQRPMLSLLVSSRENLPRVCGSELLVK